LSLDFFNNNNSQRQIQIPPALPPPLLPISNNNNNNNNNNYYSGNDINNENNDNNVDNNDQYNNNNDNSGSQALYNSTFENISPNSQYDRNSMDSEISPGGSSQIGSQDSNSSRTLLSTIMPNVPTAPKGATTNRFQNFKAKRYTTVDTVTPPQKRDPPPLSPVPKKVAVASASDSFVPVPKFVAPVEPEVGETLSSDSSDEDSETNEFNVDNQIFCMFEQVKRSKNKWKFVFKNGVMHVNGRDHLLFQKATGDAEW